MNDKTKPRALDAATSHFRGLVDNQHLKEYHVPEWGISIYYRTTISWREQSQIMNQIADKKTAEALIETLMLRCLNEDGSRMFTTADRTVIQNEVDPNVIIDIVTQINNDTGQFTPDEIKKKS
tara:strand:- start:6043 stop:6411 length:369 start_codon:yes stop_codon:yes gene_type:complete